MARARELDPERGGPTQANVFTKILLALFGEYDWGGVPAMPVEIMLLPRLVLLQHLRGLLLVADGPRPAPDPHGPPSPSPGCRAPGGSTSCGARRASGEPRLPGVCRAVLGSLFVEELLHRRRRLPQGLGAPSAPPLARPRDRGGPRLAGSRSGWPCPGGLGGIFPAMANAVLALRLLGYPDDHPLVAGQIKEIEALGVEDADVASTTSPACRPSGTPRSRSTRSSSRGSRADHPAAHARRRTG